MNATAADYGWLDGHCPELTEAYCLTLVRGLAPEELLTRLGAADRGVRMTGTRGLVEAAHEAWDGGDSQFVGVTTSQGWALMIEPNGYVGTLDEVLSPLSRGSELVSHFRNINAADYVNWFVDGELRLNFEPLFAYARYGADPDGSVEEMSAAGLDVRDPQNQVDDDDFALTTAATFAFAERLTGVRITPELLDGTEFLCGRVPIPRP
ncbi:DUF6461 domain-containing protein [Streptomyces sp. NPDC001970]